MLDIRVYNRPQLSRDSVRVDARGHIRMPLITDEIDAACRTEGELAGAVAERYLKYLRNPQVDVFVKDYQSQPVAVVGAVNAPGRFQLRRTVRLLELFTFVGGPNQRAGHTVQIIHSQSPTLCGDDQPPAPASASAAAGEPAEQANITNVRLNALLRGEPQANPYVRAGDIISLPEAAQAFIVGNVLRPSAISLTETITVSRAIAIAGGTLPDAKSDQIRIIRQPSATEGRRELAVNLNAIRRRHAEDIVLQPGDVIEVPTSSGKRFLRTLTGMVFSTAVSLPTRVVQ